jgi:hypothetical protein
VDEIRAAYDRLSGKGQGRFLARLQMLASLNGDEWHETYYKKLSGECDGLWELRFKADGVQQRPLCFRSGPNELTLLFWAQEKNSRFVPRSACAVALRRKSEVLHDRNRAHALWLALE